LQSNCQQQTLYPVILSVPEDVKNYSPKARVRFLSQHARQALELSAAKSSLVLDEIIKDDKGAPLPSQGTFWSITHKTAYVGAVAAAIPIGIDLEEIKPRAEGLFRKTADNSEWSLAGKEAHASKTFFRYWTAKEAVLKVCGSGIRDLSKCRIQRVIDDNCLEITYLNKIWLIAHRYFDSHIASIVKMDYAVEWTIL
jgi:4'-phosphopantetheinyl transferase